MKKKQDGKVLIKADVHVLTKKDANGGVVKSVSPDILAKPHPQFDKGKEMHEMMFRVVNGMKIRFFHGDVLVKIFGKEILVPKADFNELDEG